MVHAQFSIFFQFQCSLDKKLSAASKYVGLNLANFKSNFGIFLYTYKIVVSTVKVKSNAIAFLDFITAYDRVFGFSECLWSKLAQHRRRLHPGHLLRRKPMFSRLTQTGSCVANVARKTTIIIGTATALRVTWTRRKPDDWTSMYAPYECFCMNAAWMLCEWSLPIYL